MISPPTPCTPMVALNMTCQPRHSLYGLKQVPQALCYKFCNIIFSASFHQNKHDYSLFLQRSPQKITLLLVYVDHILFFGSNSVGIQQLKASSILLKYVLGLEIHTSPGGILVCQNK